MRKIEKLKAAEGIKDLSALLGFTPSKLAYVIFKAAPDQKYATFHIPKKDGSQRQIKSPNPKLKTAQKNLSILLQDCQEEIYEKTLRKTKNEHLRSLSHGFRRQHTIFTNAAKHRKKKFVFNIDICDFFETINFGRVRGFFIKDRNFELNDKVATLIAQIACHENSLPQGSPCSPVISNLLLNFLDIRLFQLARENKCTYSRYADDITFSSWAKSFPESIAFKSAVSEKWEPGKKLKKIMARSGFSINDKKSRMQKKNCRQTVTGLTVNKRVGIPKEYRKATRAMVDRIIKERKFYFEENIYDLEIYNERKKGQSIVSGRLAFIHQADIFNEARLTENKKHQFHSESRLNTYRDFIYSRDFRDSDRPTLICEGKTDYIYIESALKALGHNYKNLSKSKKDGSEAVKFYKYTATAGHITNIKGGTPNLASFIGTYKSIFKKIGKFKPFHPVIILIDNDDGANSVIKQAMSASSNSKRPNGDEDFYHIWENLYLILTPKINGKKTETEDFFDKKTLATKISGKSFNPKIDQDSTSQYGKYIFAQKVIKQNRKSVDFENFKPILERISLAIENYKEN